MQLIKLKKKHHNIVQGVNRVYLAPELDDQPEALQNDIWSIGTILYLLVTGGIFDKIH
jgi:hypothetical protein